MSNHAEIPRRALLQTAVLAGLGGIERAKAADPIRIGIPVALTGPNGGIGAQMRRACDFWAKQVTARGGLLGRPIELIVEDTAGNPATCVRKVQEMVEGRGVRIITCIVASNEALAVVPKLGEWNTIFISGDNGDGRLTAQSLVPNFFRPNISGPMGTRCVALWLRQSPMKKFYGLGMDYAWGHNSMEVFENEAKKAGKDFLGAVFSPTGTKDFSTYITKLRGSGADAVYLVLAGDDYNAFLTQARQYRLSSKMQMLTEQVDEMTLTAVGDAAIGLIGSTRYPVTLDNPENKTFVAAWQKEHGRPPQMFEGDQYQSCVVLQAAIEKAGAIEAAKLRPALEGLTVTSVKGPIEMRACDHQASQPGFIVKAARRDGVEHPVPEVLATYPADKVTPPCNKMQYDD